MVKPILPTTRTEPEKPQLTVSGSTSDSLFAEDVELANDALGEDTAAGLFGDVGREDENRVLLAPWRVDLFPRLEVERDRSVVSALSRPLTEKRGR